MIRIIQFTTALFLLVQTTLWSQTQNTEAIPTQQKTALSKEDTKTKIKTDHATLEKFVGTYFLTEADFELQIVKEDDKMYIISPFSKDMLIQTNDTTLHELTRGVDLELIADNKNALKYTQNGYVTTIRRVKSTTQK